MRLFVPGLGVRFVDGARLFAFVFVVARFAFGVVFALWLIFPAPRFAFMLLPFALRFELAPLALLLLLAFLLFALF